MPSINHKRAQSMHSLLLDTTMMVSSPSSFVKSHGHKRSKSSFVGAISSFSCSSAKNEAAPQRSEDPILMSPLSCRFKRIRGMPDVVMQENSSMTYTPPTIQVPARTSVDFPSPGSMPCHLLMPTLGDLEDPTGREPEEDDEVAFLTTSFNLLPRMLPSLPLVDGRHNDALSSF